MNKYNSQTNNNNKKTNKQTNKEACTYKRERTRAQVCVCLRVNMCCIFVWLTMVFVVNQCRATLSRREQLGKDTNEAWWRSFFSTLAQKRSGYKACGMVFSCWRHSFSFCYLVRMKSLPLFRRGHPWAWPNNYAQTNSFFFFDEVTIVWGSRRQVSLKQIPVLPPPKSNTRLSSNVTQLQKH